MMDTTISLSILFPTLFIISSMTSAFVHAQGLELTMQRDLLHPGSHNKCAQLTCRAIGNSHTIDSISMATIKAGEEHTKLLQVTTGHAKNDIAINNIRGKGSIVNNIASIYLDLLKADVCDSSSFLCEVTFRKESGERQRAFATAGPSQLWNIHSEEQTDNPPPVSEVKSLKDQLNKMEEKFESLRESFDRRMALVYDTIQSVDTSSRVARLEDKMSSILLPKGNENDQHFVQAVANMEMNLEELNASIEALQDHQIQKEKPTTCVRGMGNDVTKGYPTYAIMESDILNKQILCETQKNGGGWIVIQRRAKGDVDFYRDWTSYRDGFGSPTGDFWMGNEAIHQLTNSAAYELRVDIRFKGQELFAEYAHFRIEDETNKYRLQIGQYTGNTADGLTYSNNQPFSTFEVDNDSYGSNCAIDFHGAWWYKSCSESNLNGQWGVPANKGNFWKWAANKDPVTYSEMKIRRI